ncbi:hypothetical protein PFICI_09187 [Pestalotiopsis fici W106-1]|uniref:NACHT domain-containing protein n=1 Tax=Pestalotiopsis fici (strain W106-1 / CGMCC3.15140) TaxID=1229662 RepID=W3WZZ5_PESFW|nr:uncharacterized protein PFICI_09187 [Pestalotiopsis fici W106-1]ETS79334.1 hypothetical protein PFICI_09187 [Pestalotiopsis fici W106-1]
MSTIDSLDGLFQAAARQFRDSLSPADSKEFMEFPSAKEMIEELNKRVSTYQRNSKLSKYCQRLERVSESLLPFFDIIGIFIQSNPEVPALVWGAMRMVFLLASNFSSFLDKLLAMFEKIGDRLPGYAEYYRRLLTRQVLGNTELDIPKFESTRVVKVLSYIYTDLVQFCQEACQVFGTKKRGIRYKAVAIADIFWKPFDVRFKSLLERIETHQALFLSEMQLEESKFTEYQLRKRERDSANTNDAISQFKLQVSELKQSILEREETLTVRFERILEHIASMTSDRETSGHRGDSILQVSPIFAKPGYGKTILSSLLIEDLANPPETNSSEAQQAPTTLPVLYYHFASERVEECSPTHGLRACLHQIIHCNIRSANVLDAVSIVIESDGTGQMRATDEEIRQCLLLLLKQLPPVTLILDGFDECTNPPDLFKTVYELCCSTGAKAILMGRPSCKPPRGSNPYTTISLEPWQNAHDIRAYLQPRIECLNNDGLLPKSSNIEEIVALLSCRAQGMFLWARLVVRYLSCDWLSPTERGDAIFDDTMLDGLENLYGKILAILEKGYPAQKKKVQRIFQVIAISRTPITLPELRYIVAVQLGRVTREEDLIVDFQNCLPIMCGALVECDSSGNVCFFHSSFREYILGDDYCHASPFSVTKQMAWLILTAICFSYLTYDIPRGAITTTGFSNEQRTLTAESFPLLRYGLTRVQQHDPEIFDSSFAASHNDFEEVSVALQVLEEWINQRLCVTAWVEANFSFQKLPTLEPLISMMQLCSLKYVAHRARVDVITTLYLRLEKDLVELRKDWAEVLLKEPCAIWTSTITAFAKSSFWFTQNDTVVTHLGERPLSPSMDNYPPSMILVKLQTASDKMTHATIYVLPSRQYINMTIRMTASGLADCGMEKDNLQDLCSGWKAQYRIRDISSQQVLFSVMLNLSTAEVLEVLKISNDPINREQSCPWRFIFPVTISADLHRVLILRVLVSLRSGTATGDEKQFGEFAMYSQRLKSHTTVRDFDFRYLYGSTFSPMGDAVAFFEKKTSSTQVLEVWSRAASPPQASANTYVFRGRQLFGGVKTQSPKGKSFLFHPSRPCLAFTEWGKASIWCFNETDGPRRCYQFIRKTIELLSFEDDVFIIYTCWGSSFGESVPGMEMPESASNREHMAPGRHTERIRLPAAPVSTGNVRDCDSHVGNSTSITTRQGENMTVTKHEKPFWISQEGQTGQVVKITSANGQTAQFGHLPFLQSWEPSSLTVLPITDSVKIVWDKESQDDYSILDTPSPHLPSIIERTLQSVPLLEQARSENSESLVDTEPEGNSMELQLIRKRTRIEDDSAGGEPSKRLNMTLTNVATSRDDV